MSNYRDFDHAWQIMGNWILHHDDGDPIPASYTEQSTLPNGATVHRTLEVVLMPLRREDGQETPQWELREGFRSEGHSESILPWLRGNYDE